MEIETIKRLIKKHAPGHAEFVKKTQIAERYFINQNDILNYKKKNDEESSIRNADNRIPTNFYGLLARQKAAYMFTYPPIIDVGNESFNKSINKLLGDKFEKVCKDLCVNATNAGIGWLHAWKDEKNGFKYSVVDSKQIIPIWSSDLMEELSAVFRTYLEKDDNGETFRIYEFWTDTECYSYSKKEDEALEALLEFNMFNVIQGSFELAETTNVYKHGFNEIPFVPFFNNSEKESDLNTIKPLIDAYDKVFSGFLNDLEDIQEIIFILKGYDGTELGPFLNDLKKYKTIKLDGLEGSGLETLTINIPVEARKEMLATCRKAIFEQGQGVDPNPENFGNSSGVALKFMYSLLELKAGITETEFRLGFNKFIRLICEYLSIGDVGINQTWNRTAITNDNDLATIAKDSVGIVSNKTILKNHPFVEDLEAEIAQLEKEKEENKINNELYQESFVKLEGVENAKE